jgi:methyl-accepting chemotaxis protein
MTPLQTFIQHINKLSVETRQENTLFVILFNENFIPKLTHLDKTQLTTNPSQEEITEITNNIAKDNKIVVTVSLLGQMFSQIQNINFNADIQKTVIPSMDTTRNALIQELDKIVETNQELQSTVNTIKVALSQLVDSALNEFTTKYP